MAESQWGGPPVCDKNDDSLTVANYDSVNDSLKRENESKDQVLENSSKSMKNILSVGNSEFYRQEDNRLSGWLIKVGAIGFMKTNKLLWFVYGDDTCKLYYYRNPQDLLPLGEIDISNAYFNFDASVDKPGLFEIR